MSLRSTNSILNDIHGVPVKSTTPEPPAATTPSKESLRKNGAFGVQDINEYDPSSTPIPNHTTNAPLSNDRKNNENNICVSSGEACGVLLYYDMAKKLPSSLSLLILKHLKYYINNNTIKIYLIGANRDGFIDTITAPNNSNKYIDETALLTIGELGKNGKNLSFTEKIFKSFNCESESVKWAASFALGNISMSNMNLYIPSLILMINKHIDRQYLFLNLLNEILSKNNKLILFTNITTPLILSNSNSNDEGLRTMIAECLGKFAIIDNKIFYEIEKKLLNNNHNNMYTHATLSVSIKSALQKYTIRYH